MPVALIKLTSLFRDLFVLVAFGAIVSFHELCTPLGAQVADGADDAVGVFMPLEGTAEAAAHDAYADFLRGGIYGEGGLSWQCEGCQGERAAL